MIYVTYYLNCRNTLLIMIMLHLTRAGRWSNLGTIQIRIDLNVLFIYAILFIWCEFDYGEDILVVLEMINWFDYDSFVFCCFML